MGWVLGLGNGVVFRTGGGSTFWSSLISATVEDAAPTNVVLTFPTAKPALGASDFTIAGFTVSSASWTGNVLTLVLSYAVTYYSGNLIITFVHTGQTATVTNNVAIANTIGWYVAGDGSSTYVTKDGSDFVSVWKDLSGSNHPLNQATGTNQPKWNNGIILDGVDNFLRCDTLAINQPIFYYLVMRQITWTLGEYFFDGETTAKVMIYQHDTSTNGIKAFAGTESTQNNNLAINTFAIIRVKYNGANSSLQVNNTAATTGDFGTNTITAFTLGKRGSHNIFSNAEYKEIILKNTSDDVATQTAIYNYLANKYGFVAI